MNAAKEKAGNQTAQPKEALTPMKAIRAKCLDCACGQYKAVRECDRVACALWAYRMGHRPTSRVGAVQG